MSAYSRALYRKEQRPRIVTAGGWARSGKGTSMGHLKGRLEGVGRQVRLIDQGIKFRAIAEVAIAAGQPLDSPTTLNDFVQSSRAQRSTLEVLAEISTMGEAATKDRLYTPKLSKASGKVGKVPAAHEVAVRLLRSQVEEAAEAKVEVLLVDGRGMKKYAELFTKQRLARFVMDWYFECDPAVAARRSLGLFSEPEDLTADEKQTLLAEILNISDRNKSDMLRAVDPLRKPTPAYNLDLLTYRLPDSDVPYKQARDIQQTGAAIVNTSYTNSIQEMTDPITELSMYRLLFERSLSHQDVGIRVA